MKTRSVISLALLMAVGSAWSKDPTLPIEDNALLFEVGVETSPEDILTACALLCRDADLHLRLRITAGKSSDLLAITFRGIDRLDDTFDPLVVILKEVGAEIENWEGEGSERFESLLKKYAEVANLSGQEHLIILRIQENVSCKHFREFLELLLKVFNNPVIAPDTAPSTSDRQATDSPSPAR